MTNIPLTPEDVNEIVSILDGSAYDRLDIRTSRFRLRVLREGEGWAQEWDIAEDTMPAASVDTASAVDAYPITPEGCAGVPAPLPGTFYRAPAPGALPFVEPGDAVTADTVVGIVETMKLMNPVHAGLGGTIVAILIDNAAMVDTGTVLMHVRPS
jgi:acetyl-CoA carboxylase biotin carboxyl carrier protein